MSLLGPEKADWRKRHSKMFGGNYRPPPGAEPLGHKSDEDHLWEGSESWFGKLKLHLTMVGFVALTVGVVLVVALGGD